MPESQSVQELMFDGGDAVAVFTDGQPLPPDALVAHRGETASRTQGKHSLFKSQIEGGKKKKEIFKFRRSYCTPALSHVNHN